MRIGVLGTGMVGHALADRLAELGHEVRMRATPITRPLMLGRTKPARTQAPVTLPTRRVARW